MKKMLIIDLETSGTDKMVYDIIQIGAVKLDEKYDITDELELLIKPLTDNWDVKAADVHKISKNTLKEKGMELFDALIKFEKWVQNPRDYISSSWGTHFDIPFLFEQYKKINREYPFSYRQIDVASIVRFYLSCQGYGLHGVQKSAKLLGVDFELNKTHQGLYDAILAAKLLKKVYDKTIKKD